jgi:hypothetical protein
MATTSEYDQARAAVLGGSASSSQISMVQREAKQAGSRGNLAREALRSAGLPER